ncbi:MAG: methyltransferase domain-containing protein [Methylohalobius sp. ZOD2]
MSVETHVLNRYAEGARNREAELCCPVDYDRELLTLLPQEIIDKDYGCGDPSRYVQPGDTVLDLGSGSGKICYMTAQLVGANGRVIGVDMNDAMLDLARKYQAEMAEKLGGDRVRFVKGLIQDLALDVEDLDCYLREHPIHSHEDLLALKAWQTRQKKERPLIPDASVDLVISNCVLNLVDDGDKRQLFREIFRAVKPGGRIAISDIVCDEPVPEALKQDPKLWSGCISGALQEHEFLEEFAQAGFIAVKLDKWGNEPWQVVEGIEFRTVTVTAIKPEGEACIDYGHAVIYKGPFDKVYDEEGHVFCRGQRMAVCERTFRMLTKGPYREDFIGIAPAQIGEGKPWCAPAGTVRAPTETKGGTSSGGNSESCCC